MPTLKEPKDRRQIAIVVAYLGVLASMYFVDSLRHPVALAVACGLSFLNAVVIHNAMHAPLFRERWANTGFRWVLSFGNLYPASANIPSHNVVHHGFDDDGDPDWAAPLPLPFRHPLLNLLHFPNVVGPRTFEGVRRWARRRGRSRFRRQYRTEALLAFTATLLLLAFDFWAGLLFVIVPQLFGARSILRINLIQHAGADLASRWNHSRNFVGRAFNWIMCNNGYHTIHHHRPQLHWSVLDDAHEEVRDEIEPSLLEPSLTAYLWRTFLCRTQER
ncbi:MAG: fatty acid desaturase [Myxococcota bacterium]